MEKYVWKEIPGSSHDLLRRKIRALPPGMRLLDLGAAGGHLGRAIKDRCAFLAGVEPHPPDHDTSRDGYDEWRPVDALHAGDWPEPFDVVVCADVLEHFAHPEELLAKIRGWLKPSGVLLTSIPNIANISMRLALLAGQFNYADRGLLDRTHLTFFTRRTAKDLLRKAGFRIRSVEPTAMPYELAFPSLCNAPWNSPVRALSHATARAWPTVFGYQFLFEAIKE